MKHKMWQSFLLGDPDFKSNRYFVTPSPSPRTSFRFEAEASLVEDNRPTELDKASLKLTNGNF